MLTRGVTKTLYKVSDFLSWQREGLLILAPRFQRRAVWPKGAKTYLMDTIIKGLPIPIIFLREQRPSLKTLQHKREIVDGQQRIRTVISFVAPSLLGTQYNPLRDSFRLQKTHNKEFANMRFRDLPPEVRRDILDFEFSVHILPSSTTDREVVQMFARMNATGFKLNAQELRNAAYFGEFKTSMHGLAAEQLQRWIDWGIFTWDNIMRMQEVELTSEFAQLFLNGIVGKSQSALSTLSKEKDPSFPERSEVERRFRHLMDLIQDTIGGKLPNSPFRKRAPFFALFAVFYDAVYGINSKLKRLKPPSLPKNFVADIMAAGRRIHSNTAPQVVLDSLARRTTHPQSRRAVIQYLRKSSGLA